METKPGYKTTEFWGHAAVLSLAAVSASGVLANSWVAQAVSAIVTALASAGYSLDRARTKLGLPPTEAMKDGWKTSEFWMFVAVILASLTTASGALGAGWIAQAAASLAPALAAIVYGVARSRLKLAQAVQAVPLPSAPPAGASASAPA